MTAQQHCAMGVAVRGRGGVVRESFARGWEVWLGL